ncbi:hypothetical protein AWJ20_4197 [Sugiyamaella lignohabitans]|uniref:Uncharacterized protein n=1 Tax=Sugiyamaella lignohabitans TaxID=796027 RepID=A0A161HJ64_9ASCO|nr:uncharacterized protein AWJ20_4197 [Sugiyamaella lignohabitans]ANB11388.1 hypothetical protein AWJ20_4197 [Sugiyamaella lignohabitans]
MSDFGDLGSKMSVNSPLLRAQSSSPKIVVGNDTGDNVSDFDYSRYNRGGSVIGQDTIPEPDYALKVAYRTSIFFHALAISLTIASIYYPRWLRGKTISDGTSSPIAYSYIGLGEQCLDGQPCTKFPAPSDCRKYGEGFCAAWQSAAFAMWVSLVFQTTSEFALICTVIIGTKPIIRRGWKLICILVGISILFQFVSTITTALLLETTPKFHGHDNRIWALGTGWGSATVSWVLSLFITMGISIVGIMSQSPSDGTDDGELYDNDLDSFTTDGDGLPRDDFYYYNRQTRRNYLACNT